MSADIESRIASESDVAEIEGFNPRRARSPAPPARLFQGVRAIISRTSRRGLECPIDAREGWRSFSSADPSQRWAASVSSRSRSARPRAAFGPSGTRERELAHPLHAAAAVTVRGSARSGATRVPVGRSGPRASSAVPARHAPRASASRRLSATARRVPAAAMASASANQDRPLPRAGRVASHVRPAPPEKHA